MKNNIINLKELESKLQNSNDTFENFTDALWIYLCSCTKPQLRKLSKELNIIGKYVSNTNIANINLEILKFLNIEFML